MFFQSTNNNMPMNNNSTITTTSTTLIVVVAAALTISTAAAFWFNQRYTTTYNKRRYYHHHHGQQQQEESQQALDIERHIQTTQKPAQALGIRVYSVTNTSLALYAPLKLNHNVHGTAFAGSLYSVAVLTSYYLGREWLLEKQQQALCDSNNNYTLVAKSGSIQYKRPVTCDIILAQSILPSSTILNTFWNDLQTFQKATMRIDGCILLTNEDGQVTATDKTKNNNNTTNIACEYSIEVCAFLPRTNKKKE